MYKIIIALIEFFIIFLFVSQILYPLFFDKPFFWLFRKKDISTPKKPFDEAINSINEELESSHKKKEEAENDLQEKSEKVNKIWEKYPTNKNQDQNKNK